MIEPDGRATRSDVPKGKKAPRSQRFGQDSAQQLLASGILGCLSERAIHVLGTSRG